MAAAYRRVYDSACVSLWAWWEVVAAHHRVHDYAHCYVQADCLRPGSTPSPYAQQSSMGTFTSSIINVDNAVSVWQIPADGCYGRCDDHYESGKQKVRFTELLSV